MIFGHILKSVPMAASPNSGDDVHFLLGHFGEDERLLRDAFKRERPNCTCSVVIFTHDAMPRREFCSHASLSDAVPKIEAAIRALPEGCRKGAALAWVGILEGGCVAMGKIVKLAGL
jgi:hypothetical protein